MSDIVERLAPCPFCGGEARAISTPAEGLPRVICLGVNCCGHNAGPTIEAAITAWNRRSDATIAALRVESGVLYETVLHAAYDAGASESASTITALREEVERLTRTVNQYAYERDKAREERDQAERRSEQFWRGQLTALRQRVVEWHAARNATLAEPVADVRKSETFRVALNRLSNAEDALAWSARALVNEMETTK